MNYLSVCSGIEAVTQAWAPLGFTPVAVAEIEAFPSAVLRHHAPNVPNLGDLTKYREWPANLLGATDILAGGTPCQAFSIAGLRNSLADERGNLSLTFIHLLDRIDENRNLLGRPPAFCLWENVPGVLNTADNAFGSFLAGLAGGHEALVAPRGGWGNAGFIVGPKRAIAWRILDAQYFGLAQRRERVFVVAGPRDGPCPAKILFEFESVRRDSPPGRGPRESPAGSAEASLGSGRLPDITGTLSARTGGGGGLGTDFECTGGVIPEIADPVTGRPYADRGPDGNLLPELARCVTKGEGQRNDWETCTIIPQAFPANLGGTACASAENLSPALGAKNPTAVAFSSSQSCPIGETDGRNDLSPPLISKHPMAVVFSQRERGDDGRGYARPPQVFGDIAGALETVKPHCVAQAFKASHFTRGKDGAPNDITPPLSADADKGDQDTLVLARYAVRRLTPTECERLQGFPDGHTAIPWRGKAPEDCPDSPRYKALGNSMACPVIAWIGKRILAATER